jgi:broad specificity phosphatase PhoE
MEEEKDQAWWREQNLNKHYINNIPTLLKIGKLTPDNIHEFIIPYVGNDYDQLNKDINRNLHLLASIITLEVAEKKNIEYVRKFIKSNLVRQVDLLDKIVKEDKLQLDPRIFIPKIDNIFEILFVRHGISCSNVIHDKKDVLYFDSELTLQGIERSVELHPNLMNKIKENFENKPYSIIASSLIRAQETAYYMLAKQTKKSINVAPFIAERSMSFNNFNLPKEEQHEILNKIDPEIVKHIISGKDAREKQDILTKSYPEMFFDWANKNLDFFEKGEDGIYRAVTFTHGGILDVIFKIKAENNDIVHAFINGSNYSKPAYEHYRIKPLTDEYNKCPNGCRISFCP